VNEGNGEDGDWLEVFLLWISDRKCLDPFLKSSFANSHLSATIFLNP
jgi:hypothetical protein